MEDIAVFYKGGGAVCDSCRLLSCPWHYDLQKCKQSPSNPCRTIQLSSVMSARIQVSVNCWAQDRTTQSQSRADTSAQHLQAKHSNTKGVGFYRRIWYWALGLGWNAPLKLLLHKWACLSRLRSSSHTHARTHTSLTSLHSLTCNEVLLTCDQFPAIWLQLLLRLWSQSSQLQRWPPERGTGLSVCMHACVCAYVCVDMYRIAVFSRVFTAYVTLYPQCGLTLYFSFQKECVNTLSGGTVVQRLAVFSLGKKVLGLIPVPFWVYDAFFPCMDLWREPI